ncbi:uncharacterized protein LOC142350108 [Convolutriloba macropyga]|uniref:uncharacterized protein LOC142350108 n=1 Tax=Convolutriloba macropyga TaxID=536237 RepID=UPI003F522B95
MCTCCCCKVVSICFLVVVNIIVLLINVAIISVLLYAQLKWDIFEYLEMVGLEEGKNVFYVIYAVLGCIAGLALLGLIACCCSKKILMTVYAIICIIFLTILIAVTLAWIGIFIWVLKILHDQMVDKFKAYDGEYAYNIESVVYNVMFVGLQTCGVDGPGDFVKYNTSKPISKVQGFSNYTHPLTCCENLLETVSITVDMIDNKDLGASDWEKMKNDQYNYFMSCQNKPNPDGSYPIFKKYLTIVFVVVLVFLLILVLFLTLLVCAACSIIKNGAKKDKWSKRYNKEDKPEK